MSESELDRADTYSRLDTSGLYGRIAALPDQILEAWSAARTLDLPADYASADRIVVLGMGGSGIGGALLRALAIDFGTRVPVEVVRSYTLPAHIDGQSLVIASSNSGNTEETVSAFSAAMAAGAKCVAITTGGGLLELARRHNTPALTFTWEGEPRSALGWSFATLLAICGKLGLMPGLASDLDAAVGGMRSLLGEIGRDVPEASNPAKQLARHWVGGLPVTVGADAMAPVAYRWRTQINENGKNWAVADELSEMNHNAPVGYGLPSALLPLLRVVFLRHASAHPRISLRIGLSMEQMAAAGVSASVIDVAGATVLEQMLWAIQFGDLASYYLGLLNGADPSEVRALDWLKGKLSAIQR